jgi:hypothetical protein
MNLEMFNEIKGSNLNIQSQIFGGQQQSEMKNEIKFSSVPIQNNQENECNYYLSERLFS